MNCPTCGHSDLHHASAQHWPEGTCSICRREMNPFVYGHPRAAADVCKLTSREVTDLAARKEESA